MINLQRTKTQTFKSGCEAHIKLKAVRKAQKLLIVEMNENHNHTVTKEDFVHYLPNRAMSIADLETKSQIEEMIKAKANARLIMNFLCEKTQCIEDVRAIHNFKRNIRLKGIFNELNYCCID